MTEAESATNRMLEQAEEILAKYGFSDDREGHEWNRLQMVRNFDPVGSLVVWVRREILQFQWTQGYGITVGILVTTDVDLLETAICHSITFLTALQGITPSDS